jgi:hypothetical protein
VDELALASPSSKIRALFPALAMLVNDPFAAAGRNALGGFPSRAVDISHAAMKPRSHFVFSGLAAGILACLSGASACAAIVSFDNVVLDAVTSNRTGDSMSLVGPSVTLVTPGGDRTFSEEAASDQNTGGFASSVPEASTWTMIILWVAVLGLARSRRPRSAISIEWFARQNGNGPRPPSAALFVRRIALSECAKIFARARTGYCRRR